MTVKISHRLLGFTKESNEQIIDYYNLYIVSILYFGHILGLSTEL